MSKTIGMYGGKFIPLHEGHMYAITRASSQVDKLYVVVSYVEERDKALCEKGNLRYIPYQLRQQWLLTTFQHMPNIEVLAVEDSQAEDYSTLWEEGAERIKEAIPEKITHVYSSEPSYDKWFKQCYGEEVVHVVLDELREQYPISATDIREKGVFNKWDMIPNIAKPYYTKKVAFVGTESCGKTTLVKNLAHLYSTEYVEEYGRTLSEELGNGSDLMNVEHYKEIIYGHKYNEHMKLKKANKYLFIDSEAVVTQYYAQMYLGEEQEFIEGAIQSQDDYDLYIYLEPDVAWVDDGLRTHGTQEQREANNQRLKGMFDDRGITYVTVSGTYDERLLQVMNLLKDLTDPTKTKQ